MKMILLPTKGICLFQCSEFIPPSPGFDPAAAVRELRDGAVRPPRPGRVGDDDAGEHPGLPVEVARVAQAGRGQGTPLQEDTGPHIMR